MTPASDDARLSGMTRWLRRWSTLPLLGLTCGFTACGSDPEPSPLGGAAGAQPFGGAGSTAGGASSGASGSLSSGSGGGGGPGSTAGSAAGGSGDSSSGGMHSGGAANGGTAGGGMASGGTAGGGSGGAPAGGGGAAAGGGSGAASGGNASGGAGGAVVYSTDKTTFGGQPRCQGFDVCESFESTEPGALPAGFTLQGYGTRTVGASTKRAMRGARSLELSIGGSQAAVTAWLTRSNLGALGAQHFGRAFYRIESPAPAEFVHFDLFEGSGPYGGHTNAVRYASTGTGVGNSTGNWSFIYNVQPSGNGAGGEFGSEGNRSAHPRVDDWMCLEWSFDSAKQVAQYYLDGAAIDYLKIDTERAEIPVFSSVAVGFAKYQNTGAFLVYIDEIAFDGERIGCNN